MSKATIYNGDCRLAMRKLPPRSVHCAVTSPPYWGLRDYKTAPLIWGGDAGHAHEWTEHLQPAANGIIHAGGMSGETLSGRSATRRPKRSDFCACGAWRGSLGLEPSPGLFIRHLLEVFAEVWRVLRDDGTLWLNIGDSYANDGKWGGETGGKQAYLPDADRRRVGRESRFTGLKAKELVGVPWMLAFALRDAGWYLRSDIIWDKPNGMTESVDDRPTKAHEYMFLLAKRPRYYYDPEPIKELCESGPSDIRKMMEQLPRIGGKHKELDDPLSKANGSTNIGRKRAVGGTLRDPGPREPRPDIDDHGGNQANGQIPNVNLYRNKRSVWRIATEPYPGAHFATFPKRLAEPCILAGTSERGCCPECGSPWRRQTEQRRVATRPARDSKLGDTTELEHGNRDPERHISETVTTGWAPGCKCEAGEPDPCTVLDPFCGAATALLVAQRLGRNAIGCELNAEYAEMGRRRLYDDAPLLANVEVVV